MRSDSPTASQAKDFLDPDRKVGESFELAATREQTACKSPLKQYKYFLGLCEADFVTLAVSFQHRQRRVNYAQDGRPQDLRLSENPRKPLFF